MDNYKDVARILKFEYSTHRVADPYGSVGKWFAIALQDGKTDHVLYDSKSDCIRHQAQMEYYYLYVRIAPHDMSIQDAETYVKLYRKMYRKGIRLTDPEDKSGGKELIYRSTIEDQVAQIRGMFGTGVPTNIRYGR